MAEELAGSRVATLEEALEAAEAALDGTVSEVAGRLGSHTDEEGSAASVDAGHRLLVQFDARLQQADAAAVSDALLRVSRALLDASPTARSTEHGRVRRTGGADPLCEAALAYARRAAELTVGYPRVHAAARAATAAALRCLGDLRGAQLETEAAITSAGGDEALSTEWKASLAAIRAELHAALQALGVRDAAALERDGQSSPLKQGVVSGIGDAAIKEVSRVLNMSPIELKFGHVSPDNAAALSSATRVAAKLRKIRSINGMITPTHELPALGDRYPALSGTGSAAAGGAGKGAAPRAWSADEDALHQVLAHRLARRRRAPQICVGSWNLRVTRVEHGLRPGHDAKAVANKLSRVRQLMQREGMAVFALQECPGLGIDPSLATGVHQSFLDELLRGSELRAVWTLTHSESSVFLYDPDVVEPLDVDGAECGVCLESPPGSGEMAAVSAAVREAEWREHWPELSAAAVCRRAADAAVAKAEAAEAAEAMLMEKEGALRSSGPAAAPSAAGAADASAVVSPEKAAAHRPATGTPAAPGEPVAAVVDDAAMKEDTWFKRPPAVGLFRYRGEGPMGGVVVGIVSVHLKATDVAVTQREARMLARAVPAVEAAVAGRGGGAVLVVGDFNLAPPGDATSPCPCDGAFDPLVRGRGYRFLVRNDDGRVATNADALVTEQTGGRCYDNCFVKAVGPAGAAAGAGGADGAVTLSASADVLLGDAFARLSEDFQRARRAAVEACRSAAGVDDTDAASVAEAFFAAPANGTAGKLARDFNSYCFGEYSDHKALRVALLRS